MKKIIFSILLTIILNFAFAFPRLEAYQQGSINIRVPVSWAVQIDENQGAIYLREDPNDSLSPEIFFITIVNTNNNNPQTLIKQAIQNMSNLGMTNIQVIDSQEINNVNGLMTVISGTRNNQAVKSAFISFANGDAIALAGFNARTDRFDDLGGTDLIYVTVGGQDPAQYGASNIQNLGNSQLAIDPLCSNPNDEIYYDLDYCIYERLTKSENQQEAVDIAYLFGSWEYFDSSSDAILGESAIPYQNTLTGELIYDSNGTALSINLYNNGIYEILYLYDITSSGCNSKVEAFEQGSYQFNGLTLSLSNGTFRNTISACGQADKDYNGRIQAAKINLVFQDKNKLFFELDCSIHQYIVACGNYGKHLFGLERLR